MEGVGLARVSATCAVVLAWATSVAHAGTVTLDNGIAGVGHVDLTADDFGSYGRWVGPNDCDAFWPPGSSQEQPLTNVAENLLFITAGANRGGVALTGHQILYRLLEGAQGDGLEGDFANLTRTVTLPTIV